MLAGWMSVRTEGCNTTGLFMWWVQGEWLFEIAGLVRLGIVPKLVYFLSGSPATEICTISMCCISLCTIKYTAF